MNNPQCQRLCENIVSQNPEACSWGGNSDQGCCYNVQTGVDDKHHMIVIAEVTTSECDFNLLKRDFQSLKQQSGFTPKENEADKGYSNIDQIKEIQETAGTVCYIPLLEAPSKKQDKGNSTEFKYDADNDQYICPNNKRFKMILFLQTKVLFLILMLTSISLPAYCGRKLLFKLLSTLRYKIIQKISQF